MTDHYQDKCYCSNDKNVWIGGAIVIGFLFLISAYVFEWFPEISKSDILIIYFILWYYLLGVGLVIIFGFIAVVCIKYYCNNDKEIEPLITSMLFFLFMGIVLILIIDNYDQSVTDLEYDIENEKFRAPNDGWGSKEDYTETEFYIKEFYPKKYNLFNKWIEEGNCDLLKDWAERNYAHQALHYSKKLIKKNCDKDTKTNVEILETVFIPKNEKECLHSGGQALKTRDENNELEYQSCINWNKDFSYHKITEKTDGENKPNTPKECIDQGGELKEKSDENGDLIYWSCKDLNEE